MFKAAQLAFVLLLSCLQLALLDPALAAGETSDLAALCRSIKETDEPQYGELRARGLERQLAAARSGGAPPQAVAGLRAVLGVELLELGRLEAAIENLAAAHRSARELGLDPRVRAFALRFLAIAHLQRGEDLNCVERHTAKSCILPIAPEGVHELPEETRRAGDLLLEYLELQPEDLQARWLLNLARMVSGDYPRGVPEKWRLPEDALESHLVFPAWPDRAGELGIAAFDLAGGAVIDDFDGDGLLDLVSSTMDPCDHLKAFRNDGRGGFEDVSTAWGLEGQLGGLNLIHGDYDGDGDLDLFVLRGAWQFQYGRVRNSLLRNDALPGGGRRFVDVTREAGVAEPAVPTQTAAWADADSDGDLDLYVGNEAYEDDLYPSQLFLNLGPDEAGRVRFEDVGEAAGVENLRYAKGVAWGDYDDDGDPDLYVSNIGENRLYRNDGPGEDGRPTFTDVAAELGVLGPARAFAAWFFDPDNDGDLDLWVADYSATPAAVASHFFGRPVEGGRPVLYRNDRGSGGEVRFTALTEEVGFDQPLLPMGVNYGDFDNDGWLDLYVGTGDPSFEALMPNVAYRNLGNGRFGEVTFAGGFGHLQKGHGVAFGDLDNDGDQDLFHQLGGFFPADGFSNALFENPTEGRHWITLRLEGKKANRFGVGARIEVEIVEKGKKRSIYLLAGSGGSFGGSSFQQEIGLGEAEAIEKIEIRWPGSGTVDTFRGVAPDRVYRAVEGQAELQPLELPELDLSGGSASAEHAHH